MSTYYLSRPTVAPVSALPSREPLPLLVLESLDGAERIRLDGLSGWTHMPGATGLEMPPVDVVTSAAPGVPGVALQEVRVEERPVFIPIYAASDDSQQVSHRAMMDAIRALVDPLTGMFRVVGTTGETERELTVVYTGGLEGAYGTGQFGLYWRKFGLTALACQPFAKARTARTVEFSMAGGGGAFLGPAGGTGVPWPRALSSSAVIGEGMNVSVYSEVPVFPTLDLVGPMDSFTGSLSPVVTAENGSTTIVSDRIWSVSVPAGVPAGSTLRLVTDPRARSIRLGAGDPATNPAWTGALAAGQVARGSTLRPFYSGLNVLDVSAPGGDDETRVRLSWSELYRSLW